MATEHRRIPIGLSTPGHLRELVSRLPGEMSFTPAKPVKSGLIGNHFIAGELVHGANRLKFKVTINEMGGGYAIVGLPNTPEGRSALSLVHDIYGKPAFRAISLDAATKLDFVNLHFINNPSSQVRDLMRRAVSELPTTKRVFDEP